MNKNIQFVIDRALATNAAAAAILVDWQWSEKSVTQMGLDTQALITQAGLSDKAGIAMLTATNQKNTVLQSYHETTSLLLGMSKRHYRNQPAALATLMTVQALGKSAQNILDEGAQFAKIWAQLDITYVPDLGWTLTTFEAAGVTATAAFGAVTTTEVAWGNSDAQTSAQAVGVEDTNTTWYADATKKYGPDTPNGAMIRQNVPTTTHAVKPPAPPVVIEALAIGGGKVHIDFTPPASGWIQIQHQGPGETVFAVVMEKLTANFWEQGGFKPGANSFKFVGINSGGPGAESAVTVIQVT